jgi:hypothetical protein
MKAITHILNFRLISLLLVLFSFKLLSQDQTVKQSDLWINKQKNIVSKSAFLSLKANGHIKEIMHFSELLIKGSSFVIIDQNANSETLRLPDKIDLKEEANALVFQSLFKHKGHAVKFQGRIQILDDQLHFDYHFISSAFKMKYFILQLNPATFFGESYLIDGKKFHYPRKESPSQNLWQPLLSERAFSQFTAALSPHKNLILKAKTKVSLKYLHNRWQDNFALFLSCLDQKSIQFSLRLPQSKSASKPLSAHKNNLLSNGSFELGMKNWGVSFSSLNNRASFSSQATETPSGQRALMIDHQNPDPKYKQAFKLAKIQSEFLQIPARTAINYSFDVKSEKKVIHAQMVIRYQSAENIANAGTSIESQYIKITPEWKRHSFSLQLPRGMNDAYSFGLEYKDQTKNGAHKVFFDAASVRIGHSSEFNANKELAIGADIPQKNNLFEIGEKLTLKAYIQNNSPNEQKVRVKIKILNPFQKLVFTEEQSYKIAAHKSLNNFLNNFHYLGKTLGPHQLILELYKGDHLVDSYKKAFGFIKSTPSRKLNTDSKFGLHMGGANYQESLELASKVGFTWTRNGAFYNSWRAYQSSEFYWNKDFMDRNLAIIDEHEKLAMTPIVTLGVQIPKWASSAPTSSKEYSLYAPAPDKFAAYANYVKKLTQTFGQRIHAYEIWNEPNTSVFYRGTAKEFAQIIDSSYENIKNYNPQAKVIAFGLTHYGQSASDFMLNSLKHTETKNLTGISFHPYSEDRLSPEKTQVQKQFEWIKNDLKTTKLNQDLELWATEFGWFAPHENSKKFTPYKNAQVAKRLISEHECARFYIQMVNTSLAHGLDKLFYFIFQEGTMSSRWFHGFVGPNAEFLKAPYYAAATAIKNLDFKNCLYQKRFPSGLVLTSYKENMSVIWASKVLKFQIKSKHSLLCEDMYGNTFTLNPMDGFISLELDEDPIYIKSTLSKTQIIEP